MFLLSAGLVWGNGGGYVHGGLRASGNIAGFEPVATDHVRILDETLWIRAGKTSAQVEVRYLMRNVTDKRVKVRFGFPLEEAHSYDPYMPMAASDRAAGSPPQYGKNYTITARGKPLRVTWQEETNPAGDERLRGLTGWNISEITFAKGEEVPVMIRFESEYPGADHFVSETSSASARIFRYRLSSAACWQGTIGEGRVIVEADGIDPHDIRVIKPVNRFRKEGERWIWNFKDLEPTLEDDLEIECQPQQNVYGQQALVKERAEGLPSHLYATFIERGGRWSMRHSNYAVKASSTLPAEGDLRYDAENIRDVWNKNAWSEGAEGIGVGQWLELAPVAAKPLIELVLKPGYQKTAPSGLNLFKANARPKVVRVELNGEHRFDAHIPDRPEEVVIPVRGYDKPVRKIRLVFTEVTPGEHFEDMCVTSVELHVRLDREPKIQPQR